MRRASKHHRTHGSDALGSSDAADSRAKRQALAAHVRALDAALDKPGGPDLAALRALSMKGFVHDSRRQRIWPMLLGVDTAQLERQADACAAAAAAAASTASVAANSTIAAPALPAPHDYFSGVIYQHRYFDQIEKDINRSMCHFEGTKSFKLRVRQEARAALSRILHTLFSLHPSLHYVQGLHDIASVFLLVCSAGANTDPSHPFGARSNARGEELAFYLTERLALLHIRDSLRPTLDTVVQVMSLIFPLLSRVDPEVHSFLQRAHVQSFFSLSWILTWFSHNLDREADVSRVFDFFLSSHPLMPLYATVALIVQLRKGLLQLQEKAVAEARERYEQDVAAAAKANSSRAAASPSSSTRVANGSGHGSDVPASSTAAAELSLPPFDPSSIEVEMSAVHLYFQNLPPLLDLDALFQRTAALFRAHPPASLLREAQLQLPRDSPLLLEEGIESLPAKLTNYLDWKRRQRRSMLLQTDGSDEGVGRMLLHASADAPAVVDALVAARDPHDRFDPDALRRAYPSADAVARASRAEGHGPRTWAPRLVAHCASLASVYAYPPVAASAAGLLHFALATRARHMAEVATSRAAITSARLRKRIRIRPTRKAQRALRMLAIVLLLALALAAGARFRVFDTLLQLSLRFAQSVDAAEL